MKPLITEKYGRKMAESGLVRDPSEKVFSRLQKLSLLSDSAACRIKRVHRLVQDVTQALMPAANKHATDERVARFIRDRLTAINEIEEWKSVLWELGPLDAAALHWDQAHRTDALFALNEAGRAWDSAGYWARAEFLLRRACDVAVEGFGSDSAEAGLQLHNLGHVLRNQGKFGDAETFMRSALALRQGHRGSDSPAILMDLNNLADLLQQKKEFVEAEDLFNHALEICQNFDSNLNFPDSVLLVNNYGTLLRDTGRPVNAERQLSRALSAEKKLRGPMHYKIAIRLTNLAQCFQDLGRLDDAKPLMEEAIRIDEYCYGKNDHRVARDLNNLAQLLEALGILNEARPLLRRALSILVKFTLAGGVKHPFLDGIVGNYLRLLRSLEQPDDQIAQEFTKLGLSSPF